MGQGEPQHELAAHCTLSHLPAVLTESQLWTRYHQAPRDRPANDPQLMSYRSYLDSFLLPFRAGSGPDVERHNTDAKNQRQALKRKFTEPSEPGHMFRYSPAGNACP